VCSNLGKIKIVEDGKGPKLTLTIPSGDGGKSAEPTEYNMSLENAPERVGDNAQHFRILTETVCPLPAPLACLSDPGLTLSRGGQCGTAREWQRRAPLAARR
jgi:hypothetical protein